MAGSVPSDLSDCRNSTSCTKMVQVGTQTLSLRAAVEALPPEGGTLELPAGHFTGSGSCGVVVRQSNVTIRGAAGPLETVIDCAGRDRHMVLLGANISLERLRLVGGAATPRSCATSAAMGLSCSLDTNGGCLLVAGGPAAVRDCRLEGCAASGNGGGVAAYGPLTLERVQVEGCSSVRGGGVYSRAEVKAVNSSLERNSAWQGGGIFVEGAVGVLAGQGVALVGNTAQNSGGGLHAEESARIRLGGRSTVRGNTAGANGGGINLYLWAELVLEGDVAVAENLVTDESNGYGGGGVCGFEETRVELRDRAAVVDNVALNAAGGGLRLTHGSALMMGDDALLGRNKAQMGGGLYFAQKGIIIMSGRARVVGNKAMDGGGIFITSTSHKNRPFTGPGPVFLNLSDSVSVCGNTASESGGGIFGTSQEDLWGRFYIFLTGNVVIKGNSATVQGGAVHLERHSSLTVDGRVRIEDNNAGIIGGAIQSINQVKIHLGGQTVVRNNSALSAAGAIGLNGSALFVFDDVTINGNSANYTGGAIMAVSSSLVELLGTTRVVGNCAGSGGAVFLTQGSVMTVTGWTRVANNRAMTGGGVFAQESTVAVLQNASVSWNDAGLRGGGLMLSAAEAHLEGAPAVEHNRAGKAGGGMYLELQSGLSVGGAAVINENTAGIFMLGKCSAELASFVDVADGDLIHAGGGIFATDGAEVTLGGSAVLRRNSASVGGAVSLR
jgi:predicted outer membrane repeat protein